MDSFDQPSRLWGGRGACVERLGFLYRWPPPGAGVSTACRWPRNGYCARWARWN